MSYSIKPIIHPHKDKQGRKKVQIKITYKRARVYLKTGVKISPGTPNEKIESFLRKKLSDAEDKMLAALREPLSVQEFKKLFKEEKSKDVDAIKYLTSLLDDSRLQPGTIRQRRVTINKIPEGTTFSDINTEWMQTFERSMKGLDGNSINSNIRRLKTMLRIAAANGLLKRESFEGYKPPPYVQKIVDYLTESEIKDLAEIVFAVKHDSKKRAGYYFLLSCYTGWRISDTKRFDPSMVKEGRIVVRTTKNKRIVSIPVHFRLKEVIKFCSKNPFDLSEEKARLYVKELCGLAGIKWNVKWHTARHSWAMLLMANGFTIDEVSHLIGDTAMITKVYARIHNESLDKKIRERLG